PHIPYTTLFRSDFVLGPEEPRGCHANQGADGADQDDHPFVPGHRAAVLLPIMDTVVLGTKCARHGLRAPKRAARPNLGEAVRRWLRWLDARHGVLAPRGRPRGRPTGHTAILVPPCAPA